MVALAGAGLVLAACTGGSASSPSPSYTVEMPTASYSPPPESRLTPAGDITLNNIQPNDGITPVVEFINSAKQSVDISIYRIDSDFEPVVAALQAQVGAGVPVRVSISRQLVGVENPPEGNPTQLQVKESLEKLGIQVELSRPEFHYGHEKSIIIDAGTPDAKAMIADWNLQQSYFGPSSYGPVGARGMAVVNTNPEDVALIAEYFEANWPPYSPYPESTRASLVWSPSGIEYTPVGNSVAFFTDLIANASTSLDIYAEYIQDNAFLIPMIEQRARDGVKVRFIANSGNQSDQMIAQLRDAGIEIVFDPVYAPTPDATMFVHSKTMIVDYGQDDAFAFVGSQNTFINESLEAILELGARVTDPASVEAIHETFETDFASASPEPAPSDDNS
jgi:phosphatidylserine/phosphatidylglycerophosphate/cardiolipin synthase-like enzyme